MLNLFLREKSLLRDNEELREEILDLKKQLIDKDGSGELEVLKVKLENSERDVRRLEKEKQESDNRVREAVYEEHKLNEDRMNQYKLSETERIESMVKQMVAIQVGGIQGENANLREKIKRLEEDMKYYKDNFTSGKVGVGMEEIKGILLAANPQAVGMMKELRAGTSNS